MPDESPQSGPTRRTLRERLREAADTYRLTPRVLRMVWQSHPPATVALCVLTVLLGPLPMFFLYCGKKIYDGVDLWMKGDAEGGWQTLVVYVSLGFGTILVQTAIQHVIAFLEEVLRRRLQYQIQGEVLGKAATLDVGFFETPSFYDKLQRAQRDVQFRPFTIMSSVMGALREICTLICYIVALFTLSWLVLPYIILLTVPGLVAQVIYGRLGWLIAYGRTAQERRMFYLQDVLTSDREVKEVRLFGLHFHLIDMWRDLFWTFYRQDRNLAAKRHTAEYVTFLFQAAGWLGFYVYTISRTIADPLVTLGSMFMYTQAMERAVGAMETIFRMTAQTYENNLFVSNLFEYLEQEPGLTIPAEPKPVPTPFRQGLRFEGVTFRYPLSESDVLVDVSLEIGAGERIALVGENGAGKTTLIKLMSRLYEPQHGRITIDGVDLRDLDPVEWQRQIGVIFQDFARYQVTARENVGFGELKYVDDLERIRIAAEKSGATGSIERLPKGWDNVLGKRFEEGTELSLGEWQKVALARAFIRDAQILALDEPTASLDAKQEYEIFTHFQELTAGKTTILISHRFSTVRMADRIFVVEEGRIVEDGSHDELMATNGRYAYLFTRQAAGYR